MDDKSLKFVETTVYNYQVSEKKMSLGEALLLIQSKTIENERLKIINQELSEEYRRDVSILSRELEEKKRMIDGHTLSILAYESEKRLLEDKLKESHEFIQKEKSFWYDYYDNNLLVYKDQKREIKRLKSEIESMHSNQETKKPVTLFEPQMATRRSGPAQVLICGYHRSYAKLGNPVELSDRTFISEQEAKNIPNYYDWFDQNGLPIPKKK